MLENAMRSRFWENIEGQILWRTTEIKFSKKVKGEIEEKGGRWRLKGNGKKIIEGKYQKAIKTLRNMLMENSNEEKFGNSPEGNSGRKYSG